MPSRALGDLLRGHQVQGPCLQPSLSWPPRHRENSRASSLGLCPGLPTSATSRSWGCPEKTTYHKGQEEAEVLARTWAPGRCWEERLSVK